MTGNEDPKRSFYVYCGQKEKKKQKMAPQGRVKGGISRNQERGKYKDGEEKEELGRRG